MTIAIISTQDIVLTKAQALAQQLQLPLITQAQSSAYDYLLTVTPYYLGLQKTSEKQWAPFYLDFSRGKLHYRQQQASLKKELLAKALGVKPKDQARIIDATAGWARDSFILASLGFEIILLEKSPILYTLVQDGLHRAAQDPAMTAIVARMQLIHTDALTYLPQHKADVVYLDPMFPSRQKSASVKKDMAILHDLLEKSEQETALLQAALACANKRVVVKRPRLAVNIAELEPNFQFLGKHSRFDIYLV